MIPLYEVVDHIAGETGIQFNVSPQIGDVQVSARIRSNDWLEAVSKLIKSYSRVEVWTDDLRTTRIWLHDSTLNNEPSENMHSMASRPVPVRQSRVNVVSPPPVPFRQAKPQTAAMQSNVTLESLPPHIMPRY